MYVAGLDEIAKKTLRCYKYINVICNPNLSEFV